MITVPEAAEKIIKRSRYLSEAMSKGFINISSLARYMKPEIEEMLVKKVNESSIIMALNRLQKKLQPGFKHYNIFKVPPTIIVRSNLAGLNIANFQGLNKRYEKILNFNDEKKYNIIFTKGVSESTLFVSNEIYGDIKKILNEEQIISEFNKLSSITIQLPKESTNTPGVLYFLLKSLAWEGVNIIEIISTSLELTIIFEDREVNKAFSILKSLFS